MNEVAFVKKRESDWQRLTHLCDAADVSPSKLKAEEFHEFIRLYRRVSADLAQARTSSNNIQLINFLNDVVARAYGILYRSPRRSLFRSIADALELAAQTVRRRRWFVLTSAALFVGSGFFSFFMLDWQPQTRTVFVPQGFEKDFEQWKTGKFPERGAEESTFATGFYMFNNPRQAIVGGAVAAATFGLGTGWVLYENGAMTGALAHEVRPAGQMGHLFVSILPHGVTEISGLIISGAAGLVMGYALINPGRRRRGEALKAAGKDALVLLTTATLMMFMAAPIEGFFSFNPKVPVPVKALFALCSAIAWGLFWVFFGRKEGDDSSESVRQ
ncbi:MAG: stage II sporulation protein M [Fimbriimonadales bacterium]